MDWPFEAYLSVRDVLEASQEDQDLADAGSDLGGFLGAFGGDGFVRASA